MTAPKRPKINTLQATWRHPTEVRFGAGRIRELPEIAEVSSDLEVNPFPLPEKASKN